MIDKVRDQIINLRGRKIKFRYNGSRNQIEEFEGVIIGCYSFVFVVDVDSFARSFSYSDVLIGTVEVNI